jgi:branched-chain amino acid transport system ATP-binding protein
VSGDGSAPLLELDDVRVRYGGIEAVKGVSIRVDRGEMVTLIGGNGAGKSTTLKAISGIKRPTSGEIRFEGERIDNLSAHEIVQMGISQAPEGRRIFGGMSVRENLEMGAYGRRDARAVREDFERVYALFPVLKERERQAGGTLSGGQQQMLAIGRALMARPRLLTLDEPSMGLAPLLVERIFELLQDIHDQGTTVLLVEQNAHMALGVADRGYVIESGNIVLEDRADRLLGNDQVRKAYLGEE